MSPRILSQFIVKNIKRHETLLFVSLDSVAYRHLCVGGCEAGIAAYQWLLLSVDCLPHFLHSTSPHLLFFAQIAALQC